MRPSPQTAHDDDVRPLSGAALQILRGIGRHLRALDAAKWHEYRQWCDRFYFAVGAEFRAS